MNLYKKAFADKMAANGGIKKYQAMDMVNLFLETLTECMKDGDRVCFMGFGAFFVKELEGKTRKSPHTGREFFMPEHKKVKFRSSCSLTKKVSEKGNEEDNQ